MNMLSNGVIVILIVTFIIGQLFPNPFFFAVYTILTAVVAIIGVFYSRGLPRIFGLIMVVIGCSVFFYQQQPLEIWAEGITRNLPLVCLIVVVPVLGIPIGLGDYHRHLAGITSRFQQKPQFMYLFISGLFSLIAPITNLGSMYIIHAMLQKLKLPDRLLGRVYARGFTSVHTWSPYFASVFLVVYSLNIPIYQYLPYGLLLSIFQLFVGYYLFKFIEMRNIELMIRDSVVNPNYKKMYELFAVLFLLTGFIFALEPFIQLSVSVLITLTVFFFAFLWTVYLRYPGHFFKEVNEYRKIIIPSRANEVNLLLTAGFFGLVLTHTPVSGYIQNVWGGMANISIFLLIVMTISLITLLSFIGVHQIVTISALVATVSYDELGIHVMVMAMMLLSAWSVAATISPVSPVVISTSGLIKTNVFQIIRWNLPYAAVLLLVHSAVIYGVHVFLFS
ncbi:hypothetical protein CIL05_16870 [Virgibacillus profundi]|uniref:C4-dicarboxylate ABC transporter n=1 Tax=Virgibacillus profundi TaxID=2024555 RepID=A0A2A2I9A8_9BACI|nr:hypothetical protein [Virgibacillus profundi]PAV28309.1 hypothetical protein CIL05_16870 [Virgibacillus profundi]PXY52329.1 hypothetical protein CIT14_18905 [Virgibacillus profundi]